MRSASPDSTRKSSWSASQWYIPIVPPGESTRRKMPFCSNSVAPSNSEHADRRRQPSALRERSGRTSPPRQARARAQCARVVPRGPPGDRSGGQRLRYAKELVLRRPLDELPQRRSKRRERGFLSSGHRDSNSGPSVPQTAQGYGRAVSGGGAKRLRCCGDSESSGPIWARPHRITHRAGRTAWVEEPTHAVDDRPRRTHRQRSTPSDRVHGFGVVGVDTLAAVRADGVRLVVHPAG